MRGRKPTPTDLKVLRGNPGHRPLNVDEPQLPAVQAESFDTPPIELAGDATASHRVGAPGADAPDGATGDGGGTRFVDRPLPTVEPLSGGEQQSGGGRNGHQVAERVSDAQSVYRHRQQGPVALHQTLGRAGPDAEFAIPRVRDPHRPPPMRSAGAISEGLVAPSVAERPSVARRRSRRPPSLPPPWWGDGEAPHVLWPGVTLTFDASWSRLRSRWETDEGRYYFDCGRRRSRLRLLPVVLDPSHRRVRRPAVRPPRGPGQAARCDRCSAGSARAMGSAGSASCSRSVQRAMANRPLARASGFTWRGATTNRPPRCTRSRRIARTPVPCTTTRRSWWSSRRTVRRLRDSQGLHRLGRHSRGL